MALSKQHSFQERGLVLQTMPLREADLIVRILTERSGKISAVARGARKSKKRFSGGIDIFDCGNFEYHSGRGNSELFILDSVSERELWLDLRRDLQRFQAASLCLEVADAFTAEGDPEGAELFEIVCSSIRELNQRVEPEQVYAALSRYLLFLLRYTGFDVTHSEIQQKPEILSAWEAILDEEAGFEFSEGVARESVISLVVFTEHCLGRPLKTRAGAFF